MISFLQRMSWKILNSERSRQFRFGDDELAVPKIFPPNMAQTEPWMSSILSVLVDEFSGGLLDVGVNLGQTMAIYKLIEPDGAYVGLEPNPACVSFARRFAKENRFDHVTIVPAALSEGSGLILLDFYENSEDDSSASIVPDFRADRSVLYSEVIASITYPQLATQIDLGSISIVKIDVEGAESAVLAELAGFLKTQRPAVTVEILPTYSAENFSRVQSNEKILEILKSISYRIFRAEHDKERLYRFKEIVEFGIYSDIELSDYVLIPAEAVDRFIEAASNSPLSLSVLPA